MKEMKKYYFYSKTDKTSEPIAYTKAWGRLGAAKYFAQVKQMSLKSFLSVFKISR
jgi:hypothetical protein